MPTRLVSDPLPVAHTRFLCKAAPCRSAPTQTTRHICLSCEEFIAESYPHRYNRATQGGPMGRLLSAILLVGALGVLPAAAQEQVDQPMVGRIKQEGLQRSRARELYLTLTDRIGSRLTGSPSHIQA